MSIDLRPYGLDWSIDPSKPGDLIPAHPNVAQVEESGFNIKFTNVDGSINTYTYGKLLGEGSFGKTYLVGEDKVIKMIEIRDDKRDLKNALLEYIIQLLCVKDTENESYMYKTVTINGPFVPKLYIFGRSRSYFYIVSEKMDMTFQDVLKQVRDNVVLKELIMQIAKILDVLQKKDYFSHRDFKADNIMVKFSKDGPQVKLIDFGFSCMKYKELVLNSNPVPSLLSGQCYNKSRDLSSIFYYLLEYSFMNKYSSRECPMRHVIETLLLTKSTPKGWQEQYPHYNHRVDSNPNLFPENVYELFKTMQVEKTECGAIDPSWVKYIKVINTNVFNHLKPNELPNLDGAAVLDSEPLLSPEQVKTIRSAKMRNKFKQHPAQRHMVVNSPMEINEPMSSRMQINSRKRKARKTRKNRTLRK